VLTLEHLERMTPAERAEYRLVIEGEFDTFARWAFELLEGSPFLWVPELHGNICVMLDDVGRGDIVRGILNTKPRFGKSVLLGLWCAWWLVKNPRCQFLYLSGSDLLAREQSDLVRNVLQLPEVQILWKITFDPDTNAKGLWRTQEGGYFRAVSSGGQVVGFGAGRLGARGFSGCLIIDDPVKPEDLRSVLKMETMNGRYNRTLRHRVNDPRTPILVVMQRLADNDLSGFLLGGGSGERWVHLRIPGLVEPGEEDAARQRYAMDWDHGDPYPLALSAGYVWPEKLGVAQDMAERLDESTWAAQTMQNPRASGGAVFRTSWFRRFERFDVDNDLCGHVWFDGERIELRRLAVTADTAAVDGQQNDYSVFQLWGVGVDGNLYLLDQLRGKWEVPDLSTVSTRWLVRYAHQRPRVYGWREVYMEYASSGIGLSQQLKRKWGARIVPVKRSRDKYSRALSALLPLESGLVRIPASAPWVGEYLSEFAAFSKDDTHVHDDQVDATLDAIEQLARGGGKTVFDVVGV
jgi:predicted phage terminase large subunit-like protein